jgi:hypothetical protein
MASSLEREAGHDADAEAARRRPAPSARRGRGRHAVSEPRIELASAARDVADRHDERRATDEQDAQARAGHLFDDHAFEHAAVGRVDDVPELDRRRIDLAGARRRRQSEHSDSDQSGVHGRHLYHRSSSEGGYIFRVNSTDPRKSGRER